MLPHCILSSHSSLSSSYVSPNKINILLIETPCPLVGSSVRSIFYAHLMRLLYFSDLANSISLKLLAVFLTTWHYQHLHWCMGHMAWAPEGRSQAGPKDHWLEVGAQRAPTLLVCNIFVSHIFVLIYCCCIFICNNNCINCMYKLLVIFLFISFMRQSFSIEESISSMASLQIWRFTWCRKWNFNLIFGIVRSSAFRICITLWVKNGRFGRERAFSLKKCRKNSYFEWHKSGSPDFGGA